MKGKMISMKGFPAPALAMGLTIGALLAVSTARGWAQSTPAATHAECKSGDCCSLCPRTSSAAEHNLAKSSNGITLDPRQFVGSVRQAYTIAEQNPMLLAQLDCYCGCYKTDGHKSLLDCYKSRHGATCQICTNEVLDASRLFDGGMAPDKIKEALRRKYQTSN
jgi:hypothetical protein